MAQYINQVAYGLTQALINVPAAVIRAKRAPTIRDIGYPEGQIWVSILTNLTYILSDVSGNVATWRSF